MRICVIAGNYPSEGNPKHVFLEKIVKEFVNQGNECVVIAPQARSLKKSKRAVKAVYQTDKGNVYPVYSPFYNGYSGRKIGPVHLGEFTYRSFQKAVESVYRKEGLDCDVFYSHFINAGVAAGYMASKYSKPFFIANGESCLMDFIKTLPSEKVRETYKNVSGIISVSTANKEEILSSGHFPVSRESVIHVLPNGVDQSLFRIKDKAAIRKKMGIAREQFVVIFVGQFSDRKGSLRVVKALNKCEGVWAVFIGSGSADPVYEKCIYKGKVKNTEIPDYLNASDVFVLPTLNEGCCNAIVEAIACGLPVVSSKLPFNEDILDESCAVLVDPRDINEIADAIRLLQKDAKYREQLSEGAVKKASSLKLDVRASEILKLMQKAI